MENLFQVYEPYEKYKYILEEPLKADHLGLSSTYCHTQNCYIIKVDNIKCINKNVLIKDKIECLFYIYIDFGEEMFDDKYWFFIGRLKNNLYFIYVSDCCGTGFGLGSTSHLYLSKTPELLCKYGLTNKQRDLIKNNKRFNCPKTFIEK